MPKHAGECLHETSSWTDANAAMARHVSRTGDRTTIRACTLPEGGRGWRVWGYAS